MKTEMKSIVAAVFLFEKLHRGPLYENNLYLLFGGEMVFFGGGLPLKSQPRKHANLLDLLCHLRA